MKTIQDFCNFYGKSFRFAKALENFWYLSKVQKSFVLSFHFMNFVFNGIAWIIMFLLWIIFRCFLKLYEEEMTFMSLQTVLYYQKIFEWLKQRNILKNFCKLIEFRMNSTWYIFAKNLRSTIIFIHLSFQCGIGVILIRFAF